MSWGEEDFVTEETNVYGNIRRYNTKGELHSLYSPAVEEPDGSKDWYYEGKFYSKFSNGYNQKKFERDLRNKGKI